MSRCTPISLLQIIIFLDNMVISCSAYGCTNKWSRNSPVHFHKFPFRNEKLCQKWISALKRKNFTPTKASLVCSDHFREQDYIHRVGVVKKRLKSNAVPSIFNFPVFDQFAAYLMQQTVTVAKIAKKSGKLKNKRKTTVKQPILKHSLKPNDSAIIESLIDEIRENINSKNVLISEVDTKGADELDENLDEELLNANEEDKCDILGSIWGERLKLLPLNVRDIVRKVIDKIFEETISGSLIRKGS